MPDESSTFQGGRRVTGYVTDVAYPRSFVPQISPQTLRLVAALNGHPSPPEEDFDYCELGSASGDTLTMLAAANPSARFVGIELSGSHVAVARERARLGKVTNVEYLEGDFEDLSGEAAVSRLPMFDFIVAHGIWSWVSGRKRDALLTIVRARLKPGGLFYVSYNALPGWAAVEPLRRLMLDLTGTGVPLPSHSPGTARSTLDRAREGVKLAQRLSDSGAAYFGANPTAKAMLALMQKAGLPYVVHEYFHADWQPFYVADVAGPLAAIGLGFLGQVPLYANVRDLAVPPSLKKTADAVTDRIALEGLKDFATNELFRSDVYVKGKVSRAASETRLYFESTPFGTLTALANVKREVRLPFYTLEYKEPVYEAILSVIAERATPGVTLSLLTALSKVGPTRVGDCLQNLVLGGQVVPMRLPADGRAPSSTAAGVYRLSSPYNELVLAEALRDEGPLVLASPVTRGGVQGGLLEALSLRLVTDAALVPAGYAAALREYARSREFPIAIGDRTIKDREELVKIMGREVDRFRGTVLPKLVELGILEPCVPAAAT